MIDAFALAWMLYGAGAGNGQSHHEYFADVQACYSRLDDLKNSYRGFTWVEGECRHVPKPE